MQARPETVHCNNNNKLISYSLDETSNILLTGVAVGDKISSGNIKILDSFDDASNFNKGDILVTDITTPDWEPIMKISSGIITNKGGRSCCNCCKRNGIKCSRRYYSCNQDIKICR